MNIIDITLPLLPPSVNHMYGRDRRGKRTYLTQEARDFQEMVALAAREQRPGPIDKNTPLLLRIEIVFPDHRRRDVNNYVKVPEDAIARALSFDDCQVFEGCNRKRVQKGVRSCRIILKRMEETDAA